ncbi:hypothetical protein CDAR_570651 [Caerostris darwini]|uniref:Uncharacterized protein n=1 Tax=Caerostris darwini TaxID=1538125 RepID=A0AAV4QCV1_9ARAC|nr:hypothetical protein CDAR_570651 [Caerostris darwini]
MQETISLSSYSFCLGRFQQWLEGRKGILQTLTFFVFVFAFPVSFGSSPGTAITAFRNEMENWSSITFRSVQVIQSQEPAYASGDAVVCGGSNLLSPPMLKVRIIRPCEENFALLIGNGAFAVRVRCV